MNLSAFLDHWNIAENPFQGEEARQDPVFLRLEAAAESRARSQPGAEGVVRTVILDGPHEASAPGAPGETPFATTHPDFEKIVGHFERPSTSIVFGEKGSGKTAIRIQIADRVAVYNARHPDRRCLLVAYDDLNPILDHFNERMGNERKPNVPETLAKLRLVDHMDGILSMVVPRVVDALLKERQDQEPLDLGPEPRRAIRRCESALRQELLLLQALYDRPEGSGGAGASPSGPAQLASLGSAVISTADGIASSVVSDSRDKQSKSPGAGSRAGVGGGAVARTSRLRKTLRLSMPLHVRLWTALAYVGWVVPAAMVWWGLANDRLSLQLNTLAYVILGLALAYLLVLAKRSVWDRLFYLRLGHRVRRQVRVIARSDISYARSLRQLDPALLEPSVLPMTGSDDTRYAMIERLRRVLRQFGYASMVVVIDRADEPTLVSGDPERMKSVIFPMFNNKFLQQSGMGIKMLLPMELRHALFRESAAFFQEARLDKQNLVERLTWTGPMLYDLCNARLQACLRRSAFASPRAAATEPTPDTGEAGAAAGGPPSLLDLFAPDVSRQDLIEALEHMHQPRDAFKMLYQCLVEHCSNVTQDQAQWRIPKHILEQVRRAQVERVQQFQRGVRPA